MSLCTSVCVSELWLKSKPLCVKPRFYKVKKALWEMSHSLDHMLSWQNQASLKTPQDSLSNPTGRFCVQGDPLQLALAVAGQYLFPVAGNEWASDHATGLSRAPICACQTEVAFGKGIREHWRERERRGREERVRTGERRSREWRKKEEMWNTRSQVRKDDGKARQS